MTRTKKSKEKAGLDATPPEGNTDDLPIRWFNPGPDVADIAWIEDHLVDSMESAFVLFESLSGTQRLSCKLDRKSGRWMAILFGVAVPEEGHLPAMSVRGATATDAIILLAYFVTRKFSDWTTEVTVDHTSRFG